MIIRSSPLVPVDRLWERLCSYEVGPPDAAFSFTSRLARENGWSAAHALRVFIEYRRFVYLCMTVGHEVTPSDAVDQAWHLHLTFTRDYWDRFCPVVLGSPLHHGPTRGGAPEQERFYEQYALTLRAYQAAFGSPPPANIWPAARRRLLIDPQARRVHPRALLMRAAGLGAACMLMGFLLGWGFI